MPESEVKQPKGVKRSDPEPRPVEGATNRVELQGRDPNLHYVWVSKVNDPTMNPGSYRANGYRFSQYDPDGAQPFMGHNEEIKQGDRIEAFGMVLMEIEAEKKAAMDAKGQQWADRMVDTIKRREVLDETEPLTANERARMRGIVTKRHGGDTRSEWEF